MVYFANKCLRYFWQRTRQMEGQIMPNEKETHSDKQGGTDQTLDPLWAKFLTEWRTLFRQLTQLREALQDQLDR